MQAARDTFLVIVGQDAGVPLTFWRDHGGQAEYVATRGGARGADAQPRAAGVRVTGTGEGALVRLARQPQPFTLPLQLTPPVDGDALVEELGGELVGVEGGVEVDVFGGSRGR